MDDQITWSLRGATVIAEDDAQLFMPHGDHRLLIKRALDSLSKGTDCNALGKVTVHNLPWPIKAIVEPNNDRVPIWATHTHHQHDKHLESIGLSPFIYASRDLRLPMTKSLSFDITGTIDSPVIRTVYPGGILPRLPWQLDARVSVAEYEMCAAFWRIHSFLFDRAIAHHQHDTAPHWHTDTPSPFTLLLH